MTDVRLGQATAYSDSYDATLLEIIPRQLSRESMNADSFSGRDIWNAYEISWLNPTGIPQVAIGEFSISADSEFIIESKSFKYYLNSFNQTAFDCREDVRSVMERDLRTRVNGNVSVNLYGLDEFSPAHNQIPGYCIDQLDATVNVYTPNSDLLSHSVKGEQQDVQLYSHLLKSNCPVTGQPDWATVWIQYSGKHIPEEGLLRYFVSFRQYQGFHEKCVEQIYVDLMQTYAPKSLCVYARYTRRGGIDINPIRMSHDVAEMALPFARLVRQ